MYFWSIIKKNLPQKSLGRILDQFATNVVRGSERTAEPVVENSPRKQAGAKEMIRESLMGELRKQQIKEYGEEVSKAPTFFQESEAVLFFRTQQEMLEGITLETVFGNQSKKKQQRLSQYDQYEEKEQADQQVAITVPVFIRPNLSSLSNLDPVYLQATPEETLLSFEFQISSSRDQFLDRINLLVWNRDLVEFCREEIIRSNSQLIMYGMDSIHQVDQSSLNAYKRVTQFRRNNIKSWGEFEIKGQKIKSLALQKKRIQSKLSFLRVFREGIGQIYCLKPIQNEKSALKILKSVYDNIKKLEDLKQKPISNKIICLKNIRQKCQEKAAQVRKWTKQRFIVWLSKNKQESLVGLLLLWLFLQFKMNQNGIAEDILQNSLRGLQQQINKKINNQIPANKLINSLLQPLLRTISRLNQFQAIISKTQVPNLSSFALKLLKYRADFFVKYCNDLYSNYFKNRKQTFFSSILQQLDGIQSQSNAFIHQYLKTTFCPVLNQEENREILERLSNKFR